MNIAMIPVDSSRIAAIGHDEATSTLAIRFIPTKTYDIGPLYHYADFSRAEFLALQNAESVGSHFFRNIKNNPTKYPYTLVEESK